MIEWQADNRFTVGDIDFKMVSFLDEQHHFEGDLLFVLKEQWLIDRYAEIIRAMQPQRIFELGIHLGGSSVFMQALSQCDKLVAIDIKPERIGELDSFVQRKGLSERLGFHYGIDQSDHSALETIVAEEFAGQPIDLVVDDASHFLEQTRSSFNCLFPKVRPGGAYIIEDWSWAHASIDWPDDTSAFFPDKKPMSRLLFEIVLACGSTQGYISHVDIDRNSAIVWRGEADIPGPDFDIQNCYLKRGRDLLAD